MPYVRAGGDWRKVAGQKPGGVVINVGHHGRFDASYKTPCPRRSYNQIIPVLASFLPLKIFVILAEFRIQETTNLVDHLRLTDDDQTVLIFHHVGLLRHHLRLDFDLLVPKSPTLRLRFSANLS